MNADLDQNLDQESQQPQWVPSELFLEIAKDLLSEPYAIQNHFKLLTLSQIGHALEQSRVEESAPEKIDPCKSHYCMLLMELELQGYDSIPKSIAGQPLADIAGISDSLAVPSEIPPPSNSETASHINVEMPRVPQIEMTGILTDLTNPELSPEFPSETPDAVPLSTVDLSNLNSTPIENSPESEPTMISSEFTHLFNQAPPAPAPDPEPQPNNEDSPSIVAPPESCEIKEYVMTPTVTDFVHPPVPTEEPHQESPHLEFPLLEDPAVQFAATLSQTAGIETETVMSPYSKLVHDSLAKNYLTLATQFQNNLELGNYELSVVILRKLIGQFMSSVAETETYSRLTPNMIDIWNTRKDIIKTFLKADSFQLNEKVSAFIARQAERYENWLYEGKFPSSSVLSSLRYLVFTADLSKLSPTCMELGTLVYFFGYPLKENSEDVSASHALTNALKLSGLTERETTELAFRLMCLERLKAKAIDPYCNFDNDHVDVVMDNVRHILELLGKLKLETATLDEEDDSARDVA